jgi:riboflavin kinase/FMN adenylyltransferase
MLPADAVYAGFADLPDGRRVAAAINVGTRPTVNGLTRRLEAHLFNPDTTPIPRDSDAIRGVPEYNWPITLSFTRFVRDQVRFESLSHLTDQLHRDLAAITRRADRPLGTTA